MNDENTIINGSDGQSSPKLRSENAAKDCRPSLGVPPLGGAPYEPPEGGTPSLNSNPPASRSRRGKIARLPVAIRRQLNLRLENGEPGVSLVRWLNGLPEVQSILAAQFDGQPIAQNNLTRWKQGGYKDWLEEQRALQAAATVLEQADGLKALAGENLAERMTLVLTAKMAMELQRLDALPDGEKKARRWRELLGSLALVRRGHLQGERIQVEREKLGFRRERHQQDRQAEFWQWVENPEHREKILERLQPPCENEEEISRQNEARRRKAREIMGLDRLEETASRFPLNTA
jgi:hypothetical protein